MRRLGWATLKRMALKNRLHRAAQRCGFDIVRFNGHWFPQRKRAELMQRLSIDLVIDVGAHSGEYIREVYANGFDGRIVAFEPLQEQFTRLLELAKGNSKLAVHHVALGAQDGDGRMHVSGTSYSSSLLQMKEAHLRLAPDSGYVAEEHVEIRTLDSFNVVGPDDAAWLKVDTQGYEEYVLEGAKRTLPRLAAVEIELSYVMLYENQSLAHDLHATLGTHGFALAAFGRPLYDPETSALLQIDGIFIRA